VALDAQAQCDLIQKASAGDQGALQGLLLAHYDEIEATIRHQFSPELAAHLEIDDLVQEVLVDVHRGISLYQEREHGGFVPWLKRIAENCVIDTVRHYRRQKRGGGRQRVGITAGDPTDSIDSLWEWICADTDANSPYRILRNKEAREMVQICMAGLNDDQRQAVAAYYFDHMNADQISEKMNRSPAAVIELLRRARTNLGKLLGTASAWLSSR
jgi:RNA polymerase sigma factor (sigma-70 family)